MHHEWHIFCLYGPWESVCVPVKLETGCSGRLLVKPSHSQSGDSQYSDRHRSETFFFFFLNGCNFTKRDSSSSLSSSVNIRTMNPIGASQNTYFIRQRKYCSEEEKTPKINFVCHTSFPLTHTRRRKVTKYIKEKTNIAKTACGSPPQRGFGWMLQHGPQKESTARLVKAEHGLRQFLILHTTKKNTETREAGGTVVGELSVVSLV